MAPALLAALVASPAPAAERPLAGKADAWVLDRLAAGAAPLVPVVVELAERPDLAAARLLPTKEAKGRFVYARLRESARRSQAALRARLAARGVAHRAFVVGNLVAFEADAALLAEVAARADVRRIVGDHPIRVPGIESPLFEQAAATGEAVAGIESNVAQVNADDVWALGFRGESTVVAGQDTGYQWDHPALKPQYRGWNGAVADHDFAWHDAIHGNINPNPGNPCNPDFDLQVPCDDDDHGTHTMGTLVGDDGGTNRIGVAPRARWIGCRNMEEGWGTLTTYLECFDWFLAPTDLAGNDPSPELAPDVISNSWSCIVSEGCDSSNFDTMSTVVANLRAAGIAVVAAVGNQGSACASAQYPAGILEPAITVGSVSDSDVISSFSSRGPVTVDSSDRRKPDLVAPGETIRSSVPINDYEQSFWSGTSMATPHVAGAIALLISAQPALRGDVDTLQQLLEETALPLTTSQGCGGDSSSAVPNNVYGYGRIDVLAAVEAALALDLLTVDDFEVGTFARWDGACPGGVGCS
jgi:subtilisin family serine protease